MIPFVRSLFLIFILLGYIPSVFAGGENYIGAHEKGWFWYEPVPIKDDIKKVPPTPPAVKAAKKIEKKKIVKVDPWKLKPYDGAIAPLKMFFNHPAKNAKKYLVWLNQLSDRGMQMVAAVEEELRKDPTLFPYTTPGATYAASQLKRMQAAEKDKILQKYRKRFGVIVFLREDCRICEIQAKPLNTAYQSGYDVLGITPDGLSIHGVKFPVQADHGLADQLKVKAVPSTYIVDLKNKTHRLIRTGIMPYFELEQAMLRILEENHEWNPPERIEPWIKDDPRFKSLDRHGFNPFAVYKSMQKEMNNVSSVRSNMRAAESFREELSMKERVN